MEHIEYYYFKDGKYQKVLAGEKYSKKISYKNTVLDLPEDRSKPIFFRVKTNTAVQFDYKFWNKSELIGHINSSQFGFGLFFGIILFAVLFSFITYFWLKDRTYLYMSIFLLFYGCMQMAMNRFGQQFLWPNSDFMNLKSIPIFAGLTYGSFLIFMSSLLGARKKEKSFLASVSILLGVSTLISISPFFMGYRESMLITILYMTIVSIFIFGFGCFKYKKSTVELDKKVAKLFVFSWSPFLIGILTLVFKVLGLIPTNFFTNYMLQLGSIISIFMLVVLTGEKFKTLREQKEKSDKSARKAAFAKESIIKNNSQIVHDIRSPLSALEYYLKSTNEFVPEKERNLGFTAFRRLEDIINNLSTKKSKGLEGESYLLSEVLQDIVSQKRYEKIKSETVLTLNNNSENHAVFVKLNLSSFSRSLSNILNNSYEADATQIQVEYSLLNGKSVIKVTDNGTGINDSIKDKVFEDGYTNGKKDGSGLGLSYVKQFVSENDGEVNIDSSEYGTTITIIFPVSSAPDWFTSQFNIFDRNIVIVDDDKSIYDLWVSRFQEIGVSEKDILYIDSPEKFKKWYLTGHKENNIYLVDFEFHGSELNGLDLIENTKIFNNSILVTSKYAGQDVLNRVKKLKIKLMPKFCIQHTSIINEEKHEVGLVLIDDDSLTRSIWTASAEKDRKSILCLDNFEDFFNHADKLSIDTPIYIDSRLGEVRGEIESKRISDLGFHNLYITTGLAEDLEKPSWINSIVGKEPPS